MPRRRGYSPHYSHPYSAFVQRVRRHRPSDLLPVIARISASTADQYDFSDIAKFPPWALSAAAKESILHGNEHRAPGVSQRDIINIYSSFQSSYDFIEPGELSVGTGGAIMTRIAFEQFPYQESIYEEMARCHALFIEAPRSIPLQVLNETSWEDLLGVPLSSAVGVTSFLHVGATQNGGIYNPSWLDQPNFVEVLKTWPREHIEKVAGRLTATVPEMRSDYGSVKAVRPELERYGYNPLTKTPFVKLDTGIFAPQTRFILRTITPGGLYYAGLSRWGSAFAEDLGQLVEAYVGRQLQLIVDNGVCVVPEITYGSPERRTVDFFLILPDLVVLIEVKSGRPTLAARAGDTGLEESVKRILKGAAGQIENSAELVRSAHPRLAAIPSDRPMVGLIVTAEPFYMGNSQFLRPALGNMSIPVMTASLREIEMLMSMPRELINTELPKLYRDVERSTWQLALALRELPKDRRNPILDRAWDTYFPWSPDDYTDD